MAVNNQVDRDPEHIRIEFLERELEICQTFLDTAALEDDDPERRAVAEKNAWTGYDTVLMWIGTVRDGAALERLNAKLARLEQRLGEVTREPRAG